MKLKLISLVLASSLTLTACNSGSSGSQNTPVQPLVQGNAVTSVNSSGSEIAQNFIINVLSGVVGSGGNPFVIAGTFFVSGLSALFEWGSEDETEKMLEKMDGKLNTILAGMKDQFNTLGNIYDELHEFYVASMSSELSSSLAVVDADINTITSKYSQYTNKTMFDNVTFDNVSDLYEVAAKNCNEPYQSVLDSEGFSSKSLQSVATQSKVDDMATHFLTDYASESRTYDSGSFYFRYQQNRSAYLTATLSVLETNGDIMQKINYYNYENLNYAFQLAGSLQNLYNMQAVQLAYQYACNTKFNISFDNLAKLPATTQGKSGYLAALKILDATYANMADKLKQNLQAYFKPVSNKDVYELVNGQIFNSTPGLLESATFNTNGDGVGNCGVSELKLKQIRPYEGSETGRAVGVATIGFNCLTGKKSDGGFESKDFSVETPYATTSTKQVQAYEVSQIGYDTATKDIKYRIDQSTMTADDEGTTDSDMWQFSRSLPGGTIRENTLNYMLINASHYNGSGFFYGAYEINALNGVIFDNNFFYDRYAANNDIWELMPNQSLTSANQTKLTSYKNNPSSYLYEFQDWTTRPDITASNTELYFAHYNGKVFLLKILSDYYPNAINYNPQQYNNYVLRAATLSCLSSNCSAEYTDGVGGDTQASLEGKVVLTWADGTKVTMEHSGGLPTYEDISITNITGSKSETVH